MMLPLLLAVAVLACSRPPVRKPGDEYLAKIELEGNRELGDKQLLTGLALRRALTRSRPIDDYVVQVDADRIRGDYFREGFLGVGVRSRIERAGDAATVIYAIDEGVRATTKVEIHGVPDRDLAQLVRSQLALADGAPFDYQIYDDAKAPLLAIAANAGYAHARLDASVYADRSTNLAVIRLDYDLGPKCTFGRIDITGVDGDLADAVRARLRFAPGDPYSIRAILATERALHAFGRFSVVQVQHERSDRGAVIAIKVAVVEGPRRELKLGGGFGVDPVAYEVRGRAGHTVTSWPFPLHTTSIEVRPAYAYLRAGEYQPRMRALAKLERQDLLWTHAKGEVEGAYKYLSVEAYTTYGPRARLGFQTPLGTERVQLRAGWGLERLEFRNISPLIDPALQAELGLDRVNRLGTYTQSVSLDLRDNPLEPRRGAYVELRTIEGTRLAGGAFEYLQVIPELRGYVPVGRVVVAARVRAAATEGDVPVTERLFGGGASSHRGFGERALSPTVSGVVDGDMRYIPYGGAALLEAGIEARVPLTTWRKVGIGGVVFLDGGDVTQTRAQLDPFDLHWAVGAGVRFKTIAGPLRADLGYRLNRTGDAEPSPGSRFAFHISLGEAF
jgi:outer membrane protein assembly factor BamA